MEEKLIEEVRKHEVLYKKNSLVYRNKLKRAAAWKSIAEELNVPENICQARWKTLRDRYVKKHAENYHTSGSVAKFEENQWQYYQQMEFLREHIKPRKTVTSLNLLQLHKKHVSFPSKVMNSNRKGSKREADSEAFSEFLNKMAKIVETRFAVPSQKENSAHEGFFSMVREIFEDLPNDAVKDAKFFFINYLRDQMEAKKQN